MNMTFCCMWFGRFAGCVWVAEVGGRKTLTWGGVRGTGTSTSHVRSQPACACTSHLVSSPVRVEQLRTLARVVVLRWPSESQRRWLIAEVPTNSLEHGGSQRDMPRDDSPPGSRSVGRSQRDLPPRHWYQPLGIQRAGVLRSVRREGQAERSRRHAVTGFYTEARVETTRNDRTGGGTILCTFASRMSSTF